MNETPAAAQSHMNDPINRAVWDPTSGVYDCWNNFFGQQLGHSAEATNAQGIVTGTQYMAPFTELNRQSTVQQYMASASDTVTFISWGDLQKTSDVLSVSIWNGLNYYASTQANIISGTYTPWRLLWEVTPNAIPTTGPNLAEGVWIAYMKLDDGLTTTNGQLNPNFVTDNSYMAMPRAAMAGGQVLNSNLADQIVTSGQTQSVPRLVVDANDFFYFTDAHISYYTSHVYNPYADITAQGKIDGSSFLAFMSDYVYYYTTYSATHHSS